MTTSTRLTLVRHGTTDANVSGVFLGQTDVGLNPRGAREAACVGRRLAGEPIDRLVSSDLLRARLTAGAIADAHPDALELELDPGLREIHLGDFEMVRVSDVRVTHPQLMAQWRDDPASARMPGDQAETMAEVSERVWEAVTRAVDGARGGHVVLVSHTFALLTILCRVLELPLSRFRRFWLDRASVSVIRFGSGGPAITGLNGVGHLGSIGQ